MKNYTLVNRSWCKNMFEIKNAINYNIICPYQSCSKNGSHLYKCQYSVSSLWEGSTERDHKIHKNCQSFLTFRTWMQTCHFMECFHFNKIILVTLKETLKDASAALFCLSVYLYTTCIREVYSKNCIGAEVFVQIYINMMLVFRCALY